MVHFVLVNEVCICKCDDDKDNDAFCAQSSVIDKTLNMASTTLSVS